MHKNIGLVKEDEFVAAIDGKKLADLSYNLKHLFREIYGIFDPEEIVHCGKVPAFQKPDFYVEYKGERKYISLKSGHAMAIGQDSLKNFILYLREWHLSKKSQKTILYYHFGDGTLDGSGEARYDSDLMRARLKPDLLELNRELNENPEFVCDFVERYLFIGLRENMIPADYIYFGDVDLGTICSRIQIMKHIRRKAKKNNWKFMYNPHVGPLLFRPHARYVGKEILDEEKRWKVDIRWPNLQADLDYIANRYDG